MNILQLTLPFDDSAIVINFAHVVCFQPSTVTSGCVLVLTNGTALSVKQSVNEVLAQIPAL